MNVNNVGKVFGAQEAGSVSSIKGDTKLNSVFGNKQDILMTHIPFDGEEQHVLGLFASNQDNILIED